MHPRIRLAHDIIACEADAVRAVADRLDDDFVQAVRDQISDEKYKNKYVRLTGQLSRPVYLYLLCPISS